MPLTTTKKNPPQNNANQVIQSFKPKLFMLFCQINQPQQNLLSLIAQLPVKKQLTPTIPKVFQNTLFGLKVLWKLFQFSKEKLQNSNKNI